MNPSTAPAMFAAMSFAVAARGQLGNQLGRAAATGFGRAVGSMLAHGLGLPVAGALLLVVILGSLARRRPAKARARRRR